MTSTTGTTNGTAGDTVVFPEPDEIEGFWALDKMHAPRPITPLSFDLVVRTLTEGFTKAQAEYDCPIMVSYNEVNHYFYVAFHPIPDEAEVQDRLTRYHDKLAAKVPSVGKTWDEEWKPEVKAKNEAAKTADYSGLSDAELVAKLDEFTDHMRYQWWIHGHINFVLLSSSAFCDLYDKLMEPEQTTESYQTLQGFHTRSVDVQRGLWDLSRTAKASPALRELFLTKTPAEVLEALDATDEGRAFRSKLDEFLFEFGWRSDAVYDLADIPWREDPSIPLASVGALMELDDSQDPELLYQHRVKAARGADGQRSGQAGRRPATLLQKFDELYEPARVQLPAHRGPRLLHRPARRQRVPALRAGRRRPPGGQGHPRLGRRRASTSTATSWSRRSSDGGDRRDVVAERRASLAKASEVIPPTALGTPPPPPEVRRPLHGRHRLPAARHGAGRGEPRPERAAGRVRGARAPTPGRPGWCARSPRRWTSRRARSWCAR